MAAIGYAKKGRSDFLAKYYRRKIQEGKRPMTWLTRFATNCYIEFFRVSKPIVYLLIFKIWGRLGADCFGDVQVYCLRIYASLL